MDLADLVRRFNELESDGRKLLSNFTDENLADNKALSVGWELAAENLLELTYPNDKVFKPAFLASQTFSVKVEVLGSAAKEFEGGFASNELRINFLRIAYSDLSSEAQGLLDEGLLRCAAVVARVVLERHLRELGRSRGVHDAETRKPSQVNQDLWKAKAYNKGVWSEVDSWLTIGNEAAHAPDFEKKYLPTQVQKALSGIKSFTGSS